MDPPPPLSGNAVAGPERSGRQDRRHAVALVPSWLLVVYLWWRVLRSTGPVALGRPLLFVTACLLLTVALTTAWIAHNRAIYRAKGRRTGLPVVEARYERDWTGRRVLADWQALRAAPMVFVASAGRHKTFVPSRGPARHPGEAAGGSRRSRALAAAR